MTMMMLTLTEEERAALQAVRAGCIDELPLQRMHLIASLVDRQLLCALDAEPWTLTAAGAWALAPSACYLRRCQVIHRAEQAANMRSAATRLGLDPQEYFARRLNGQRWCTGCQLWHSVLLMKRVRGKPINYCVSGHLAYQRRRTMLAASVAERGDKSQGVEAAAPG